MKAIYPGTFDPITFGHLDLINRASKIFTKLIVAVAENNPKNPLFTLTERVELIKESLPENSQISVKPFSNLLINFAEENNTFFIIRGLRAVSDFEYEFQMVLMNKKMAPDIETFFMMPDEKYTYLSSKEIKIIAKMGGDVSHFVPKHVKKALLKKFSSKFEVGEQKD